MNDKSEKIKISRRKAIKQGAKLSGGLFLASPLVLAEDCVSCDNPGSKTIQGWLSNKIQSFKALYSNGYYSNGYYSNGYYSNGYYSNGYYSNGYYANGYYANGYYSNGYYANGYYSNGYYKGA